jgi:hypothetical protein
MAATSGGVVAPLKSPIGTRALGVVSRVWAGSTGLGGCLGPGRSWRAWRAYFDLAIASTSWINQGTAWQTDYVDKIIL